MRLNVKKKRDIPEFPIFYYIQIFVTRGTQGKITLFLASKWGMSLQKLASMHETHVVRMCNDMCLINNSKYPDCWLIWYVIVRKK